MANQSLADSIAVVFQELGEYEFETDDKDQEILKSLAEVLEFKVDRLGWDVPPEIWGARIDWKSISYVRLLEIVGVNPVVALMSMPKFPMQSSGLSGLITMTEGWDIKEEDIADGDTIENWHGRKADHIKAKEIATITLQTLDGKTFVVTKYRGEEGVVADMYSGDDYKQSKQRILIAAVRRIIGV